MKKTIVLTGILLSVFIAFSCNGSKLRKHYSGFVVDEAGVPIPGVLVREDLFTGNRDTTDSTGYFEFKRTNSILSDLIFSKKGYRTDTVKMVWMMHGEKVIFSGMITKKESQWVMSPIIQRDSTLNWSDKLRFYDNDSIEMYRDEKLMYTHYLNRGKGEISHRYVNYHNGQPEREVYKTNMIPGDMHFQHYYTHGESNIENLAYLTDYDSVPDLLKDNWRDFLYTDVIKSVWEDELLSESYILWKSFDDYQAGRNEEYIGKKEYRDGHLYQITKYTDKGVVHWGYYPNGQLEDYYINQSMYGGNFTTYYLRYDSLGHKTEETNWEHFYPEWGQGYNSTFSVATIRQYYQNGKVKSLTKDKSFCESGSYRCGRWTYYNEQGKIIKRETYGDCYNFELEDEYADFHFPEE